MSSASKLLSKLGGNITESIGGDGVHALLGTHIEAPVAATGSMVGRGRNRTAGTVDISLVSTDPDQPRKEFTEEAIERLAESLKKRGQLQNVRVRWSADIQKWVLISGERRYRAALKAGLPTLKCEFVERELSEADKLEDALVENCLREDLNVVELADSYRKLMELRGYNGKQLAAALDVSPSAVSKTLGLLKLPEDVREQVASGELPHITAYEISRLATQEEQREMAARVTAEKLTNSEAAEVVQATQGGRRSYTPASAKAGKKLACTLPSGGSVTVAGKEDLTWDAVIGTLAELLKAAKKAQAEGQPVEALPGLLKAKLAKVGVGKGKLASKVAEAA